jgi:hypothetical protein
MYFLIGLIIFNVLVLGANFCFLLIGGTPWHKGDEFSPVHMGKRTFTVERFAVGVSTSVFGISWLFAWAYFLIVGWDSFMAQFNSLFLHVALQFVASAGLMLAGVSIFRQWERSKGIFLTSMGLLVGSIVLAIAVYGPQGHGSQMFMYLIGAWTLVVGGYFTTAVYLLDRLVQNSDEKLPESEKSS